MDKAFKANPRANLLPSIIVNPKSTRASHSHRKNETASDLASILKPNMTRVINELKLDTSLNNSKDLKADKLTFKEYAMKNNFK